jgi:cell shape-determining protein MreC
MRLLEDQLKKADKHREMLEAHLIEEKSHSKEQKELLNEIESLKHENTTLNSKMNSLVNLNSCRFKMKAS